MPPSKTLRILPNVSLHDYIDGELFCSFDIITAPANHRPDWRPTNSARGWTLEESGRRVTEAESNLVRPGVNGLPYEWESYLFAWRASVDASARLRGSDELLHFMTAASVSFEYRQKPYAKTTLVDLVSTQPLSDQLLKDPAKFDAEVIGALFQGHPLANSFVLPIHLQANLGFEVIVTPQDREALNRLRSKLGEAERLTFRVGLRGLHKRPVV